MPSNLDSLQSYFSLRFDYKAVVQRLSEYNRQLEADKDRIRVEGQFYNNIHLGKRIFGPTRKQVFKSTIIGGVERRFEIIDSQVNFIPFTHEASDRYENKCRNPRIKCRDDTRIRLKTSQKHSCDFIHANKISCPSLFNSFIITQAPMRDTRNDFWRMIWQEQVKRIFVLISLDRYDDRAPYTRFWPEENANEVLDADDLTVHLVEVNAKSRVPGFKRYIVQLTKGEEWIKVELYHGIMNNSDDLHTPLHLLRLARSCSAPVVVVDHLGISRSACLVAIELCIMSLLKGPSYQHLVQRAVQYLRSFRPFAVETPMQYLYIHRVVREFTRPFVKLLKGFDDDYERWLSVRAQRLFVDSQNTKTPAYRLLSSRVDPDLLPQIRNKERSEARREIHAHVGELPIVAQRQITATTDIVLPTKYPRGARY